MSYYGDRYGGPGGYYPDNQYDDRYYDRYDDAYGRSRYEGGGYGADSYRSGYDRGYTDHYDSRYGGMDRNRDQPRHGGGGDRHRDYQRDGRDRGGGGRGSQQRFQNRGGRGGGRGRGGFKRSFQDGDGGYDKRPKTEADENEDNWKEKHPVMLSLYMEEAPEQLEQDWYFVVCPMGSRRLLVAANDTTQSYDSKGKPDLKFNSCLPNGGQTYVNNYKYFDLTILDTIFSSELKKFYILDMLHWKHYPYYDSEAEFRYFFLKDKYSELKEPLTVSEANEYPIDLLEKVQYSQSNLESALKKFEQKVDGLLFIRKSSPYVCHDSHETFWMKLDQMEKILGYPAPEGVSFAETSEEDVRRKAEFELRMKTRLEREAAKEKQDEELKARLEEEDRENSEKEKTYEDEAVADNEPEDDAGEPADNEGSDQVNYESGEPAE
ncbi:hypothetical protein Btru_027918 [Bulinus truncatus]|nr:hypothetical protein Btru_027918 [Bulinus truncatus]